VLGRIGDKWSLYVIHLLGDGTRRLSELRRQIGGITRAAAGRHHPAALGRRPPQARTGEKINTLISNGPWLYLIPACVFCSFMSSLAMGHRAAV
jgi:hypothetical protein